MTLVELVMMWVEYELYVSAGRLTCVEVDCLFVAGGSQ